MNKKTIIIALLALVAVLIVFIIMMGHGQESKKAVDTSKDSKYPVELMKPNDEVLFYDISSLRDVASGLTIVIREYNQQGMTDEKSLPEFGEGNTIPKSLSIGFSRKQSDSIVTVTLRSDHQDSSQWKLILKPVPDASQTLYLYEKIPYRISSLSIDTFIPLALYGSFWWDSEYKMCRFCGETELSEEEAKSSSYFENSPHYYIIGAIFLK